MSHTLLMPAAAARRAAEGWLMINVDSHDKLPSDPAGTVPRGYQAVGHTDREMSYFLNMYPRDSRALDYLLIESEHDNLTPDKGRACPVRTSEILSEIVHGGSYLPKGMARK